MNGKIKTKFAALFAVALMITVCVVPVVDNAGVDAAPVSSSNGEVFEGYDITLYKEGGDYSGLVYYGTAPAGVVGVKETAVGSGYWVDADGKLVTVDMVADYEVTKETYGFPLIQIVYGYTDAFNNIKVDVKVEQGSTILYDKPYTQSNTTKSQGHFHIHMDKDAGHTDKLNLTPEQMVGDFKVTLTGTQGFATETVTKTVNAGVATTVSGIVKDAGQNPITDKNVTVSYTLYGSTIKNDSVKTDETGKYTIAVVPGTEVKITNVTYDGNAYTFNNDVYGFGTVNSSVTKDFVANEKTGTIIIATQTSGQYVEGATISLAWYYETRTEVSGAYEYIITNDATSIQGLTAGKAVVTQTSDKNGVLKFAYADPVDSKSKLSSYALINASAPTFTSNTGIFTFTIADMPETSSDKKATLSSQITTEKGLVNLTNGSGTIYAKESVGVISITSLNGNPIAKMSVSENSFVWYYQYTMTTPGTPGAQPTVTTTLTTSVDTTNTGMNAGKLKLIDSASDSQGKIRYAYYAPYGTLKEGYSDFSSSLFVVLNPSNPTSPAFTYTFNDLVSVNTSKSMSENISAGVKTAQDGSVSFVAKENTYKISGAIEGYKYTGPVTKILDFTINNTTSYDVNVEKDGTYGFYVIKGSIINLNLASSASAPVFDKDAYEPNAFALGTVESDKVCDFKLEGSSPVPATAEYQVDISMGTGAVIVNFDYTINGEKYSAVSSQASNATNASLEISGYIGDEVTVDASIDSAYGKFVISEFDGYVATAVKMQTEYFQAINTDGPIAGATFDFIYTGLSGDIVTETLTAGDDGFVSVEYPDAVTTYKIQKDGRVITPAEVTGDNYVFGSYSTVSLGTSYPASVSAAVTIDYLSAYNVDDFYGVGGTDIAESYTYETFVGESVALKAPSIDGFEFVAWMVDGVVISESADYTLKVDGNCHVDALYSAVHYEEPAEGLSMNVLVIGIVILILGILAVAYGIISKKQ